MQRKAETVTGTVTQTAHAGRSTYGNPRYGVELLATHIDGTELSTPETVILKTEPNAMLAYAITNREFRESPHTFILTRHGHLSRVQR